MTIHQRPLRVAAAAMVILIVAAVYVVGNRPGKKAFNRDIEVPGKVLDIAQGMAHDHKIALEDFDPPIVLLINDDRTWSVLFQGKDRYFGNHFMIFIDKKSYVAEFSSGR